MKELVNHVLDSHVVTAVVLVLVAVGGVKSILGDLSYENYVETVTVLVVGTAVGRGLAAYRTTK